MSFGQRTTAFISHLHFIIGQRDTAIDKAAGSDLAFVAIRFCRHSLALIGEIIAIDEISVEPSA